VPHLRFKANGRLIFYQDQLVRWIKNIKEDNSEPSSTQAAAGFLAQHAIVLSY
jgi:hypothetical protein